MDEIWIIIGFAVVVLLNLTGLALVVLWLRREKYLRLSRSGVEAREEIAMQDKLFQAAIIQVLADPKIKDKQKALMDVALEHHEAAARLPQNVIKFAEKLMKVADKLGLK